MGVCLSVAGNRGSPGGQEDQAKAQSPVSTPISSDSHGSVVKVQALQSDVKPQQKAAAAAGESIELPLWLIGEEPIPDDQPCLAKLLTASGDPEYGRLLALSLLFFEGQQSGRLPDHHRLWWRGDTSLNDEGPSGEDLSGGWFDAGDGVKYTLSLAYAVSLLSWSVHQFHQNYKNNRQLSIALDQIRWGAEFLRRCHISRNEMVIQIGSAGEGGSPMRVPEEVDTAGPVYLANEQKPASDVAAAAAAALAAASLALRPYDPPLAKQWLTHGAELYRFARQYRGLHSSVLPPGEMSPYAVSQYEDFYSWAACWLYMATDDARFLEDAIKYEARVPEDTTQPCFDYKNIVWGTRVLLMRLSSDSWNYKERLNKLANYWMVGQSGPQWTPGGLSYLGEGAALPNVCSTAFVLMMYVNQRKDMELRSRVTAWCHSQLRYILGVPASSGSGSGRRKQVGGVPSVVQGGFSYVVGYGSAFPRKLRHGGAANSMDPTGEATNPHVLYGALVGGPNVEDQYEDRADGQQNKVSLAYNSGLTALLAVMAGEVLSSSECKAEGAEFPPKRRRDLVKNLKK